MTLLLAVKCLAAPCRCRMESCTLYSSFPTVNPDRSPLDTQAIRELLIASLPGPAVCTSI